MLLKEMQEMAGLTERARCKNHIMRAGAASNTLRCNCIATAVGIAALKGCRAKYLGSNDGVCWASRRACKTLRQCQPPLCTAGEQHNCAYACAPPQSCDLQVPAQLRQATCSRRIGKQVWPEQCHLSTSSGLAKGFEWLVQRQELIFFASNARKML